MPLEPIRGRRSSVSCKREWPSRLTAAHRAGRMSARLLDRRAREVATDLQNWLCPAGTNRWELTQKDHSLRLNVGPLTCLDARGGTVGMHVKPLAPRLRQKLDGLGSVERGQKSSRWFTRGALWVVVPVEDLTQVADRLLPEAIAFAGSVTRRTSRMYAHSQDAASYFARQSGTQLPNPE